MDLALNNLHKTKPNQIEQIIYIKNGFGVK